VACFGLFTGALTDVEFTNISLVYIGTQGAVDIVMKLRGNQQN
jgi:hypothetical protein